MGLLLNHTRELAMKDTKKNNALKVFLTSVFKSKTGFQDSQVSETTGNGLPCLGGGKKKKKKTLCSNRGGSEQEINLADKYMGTVSMYP